jgi:hypothetical protein
MTSTEQLCVFEVFKSQTVTFGWYTRVFLDIRNGFVTLCNYTMLFAVTARQLNRQFCIACLQALTAATIFKCCLLR